MPPFYLMESETEAERLRIKSDRGKIHDQLIATGIRSVPASPHVVDAGCGIGEVAGVMGDILGKDFEDPRISLLDFSLERLRTAKHRLTAGPGIHYQYLPCDLNHIPMKSNCADYVFCRFVFEYLPEPQAVFDELLRLLKPGGKLVLGDLDYNCMTHYPLEAGLESELTRLMETLRQNKLFDPYAGRKLYSFFHRASLEEIKVHFQAHHLFYGSLSDADEFNWLAKVDQLIQLERKGSIRPGLDLNGFKAKVHRFLTSPGRFSYTPLILVEGRRPL